MGRKWKVEGLDEFVSDLRAKLEALIDDIEEVKVWWKRNRHYGPAALVLAGLLMAWLASGWIAAAGLILGLGGIALAVDAAEDAKRTRMAAIILHGVLFAPFGLNVAKFANDLWRSVGLQERGLPDISNNKTKAAGASRKLPVELEVTRGRGRDEV